MLLRLRTRFHRALASPPWIASLRKIVDVTLDDQLGCGARLSLLRLQGAFNQEQFMGPHSAVKWHFYVDGFVYGSALHHVTLALWYRETRFLLRSFVVDNADTRAAERAKWAWLRRMRSAIEQGTALSALAAERCPSCASPVDVTFHPAGVAFSVSCRCALGHLGGGTCVFSPPDWQSAVSDDWLEQDD